MSSLFILNIKSMKNSVLCPWFIKGRLKCLLCDLMHALIAVFPRYLQFCMTAHRTLKCTESCPLENN